MAERKRGGIGSGDSRMVELFENIQAGDDLDKHLEEEFHRELMEQAMVAGAAAGGRANLGRVPADRARGMLRRRPRPPGSR